MPETVLFSLSLHFKFEETQSISVFTYPKIHDLCTGYDKTNNLSINLPLLNPPFTYFPFKPDPTSKDKVYMVLIAALKDENYLGWDRTVRLNIKGIGRQADDICRREMETAARWKGVFPAYYFLSVGYFAKL